MTLCKWNDWTEYPNNKWIPAVFVDQIDTPFKCKIFSISAKQPKSHLINSVLGTKI